MENELARSEKLRKQAEARLKKLKSLNNLSLEESNSQLLELHVHQIELEIQNQELLEIQHRLEETCDQYFDLFEFAPVSYFILDKKGVIENVNLTACNLLGIERNKLKGRSFSLLTGNQQGESQIFFQFLNSVFQSETTQSTELNLKRIDGTIFPVQAEGISMYREIQEQGQCRLTLRDISTEKRTVLLELLNAELSHEKVTAQQYLDMSGVLFVSLDINGNITMINKKGEEILGYSSDLPGFSAHENRSTISSLVGLNWFEKFIPYQDHAAVKKVFKKVLNCESEVEYFENNILCWDGSQRTMFWRNVQLFDDAYKVIGTLSSGTDITIHKAEELKLKNTINALHQSEQQFRNIFENVNDAILIIDAQTGLIITVNKKVIDLLGYSMQELLRMKIFDLYPEDAHQYLRQKYENIIDKGKGLFEISLRRKMGPTLHMEVNSRVIDYNGRKAFLNVSRDISKRKKGESSLMAALLEGQEKERQRIAADLHDSIQPLLSTIKRKLELLLPPLKATDGNLKKEGRYILSLLDRTLKEVKAISYNFASPALQDFGLVATLQDLCESMNEAEKATFNFYSAGPADKINSTIATGLYRIAQEMLHNAIRHSNAKIITLQLITHPVSVILMIEDNGKGFDTSIKRKGLGLKSISARVKAMQGVYEVDSMKGKGTVISVEVPLQTR